MPQPEILHRKKKIEISKKNQAFLSLSLHHYFTFNVLSQSTGKQENKIKLDLTDLIDLFSLRERK